MSKTVLFQAIWFTLAHSSIWLRDWTLSGVTTPSQSGHGSDGNEWVLHIPHISSFTETSSSDSLVSYLEHLLGKSYPSAEMQLVYCAALADWAYSLFDDILTLMSNFLVQVIGVICIW